MAFVFCSLPSIQYSVQASPSITDLSPGGNDSPGDTPSNEDPGNVAPDENEEQNTDQEVNEEQFEEETNQQVNEFDPFNREIEEGKGEFYKAYEEEITDLAEQRDAASVEGSSDAWVSSLEDLDYVAGEFDCGRFDFNCHINSFVFWAGKGVLEYVMTPMQQLAIQPSEIMDNTVITGYRDMFGSLPESLLALFLIFQILKIISMRMTGQEDFGQAMNEKVTKVVIAGILLFLYDYFFRLILNAQYFLTYPIYSQLSGTDQIRNDIMVTLLLTPNGAMMIFFIAIVAVVLLILFFQMMYSFCLIAVAFVVGPLAIVTLPNDDYNAFGLWLRILIARIITLFMQGLAVLLSFSFLLDFDRVLQLNQQPFVYVIAIGFLIVGVLIPSTLQNFGNSSGSTRMVFSSVRMMSRGRK